MFLPSANRHVVCIPVGDSTSPPSEWKAHNPRLLLGELTVQEFISTGSNTGHSSFESADEEPEVTGAPTEAEGDHGIAAQRDAAKRWEAAQAQVGSYTLHICAGSRVLAFGPCRISVTTSYAQSDSRLLHITGSTQM